MQHAVPQHPLSTNHCTQTAVLWCPLKYHCPLLTPVCHFLCAQEVEISLEDVTQGDELKPQERYHFAMSGKAFAVITEHFQDLMQKVTKATKLLAQP